MPAKSRLQPVFVDSNWLKTVCSCLQSFSPTTQSLSASSSVPLASFLPLRELPPMLWINWLAFSHTSYADYILSNDTRLLLQNDRSENNLDLSYAWPGHHDPNRSWKYGCCYLVCQPLHLYKWLLMPVRDWTDSRSRRFVSSGHSTGVQRSWRRFVPITAKPMVTIFDDGHLNYSIALANSQ